MRLTTVPVPSGSPWIVIVQMIYAYELPANTKTHQPTFPWTSLNGDQCVMILSTLGPPAVAVAPIILRGPVSALPYSADEIATAFFSVPLELGISVSDAELEVRGLVFGWPIVLRPLLVALCTVAA